MTRTEIKRAYVEYLNHHKNDVDVLNDFCNINATSYEEYMSLYKLLIDFKKGL